MKLQEIKSNYLNHVMINNRHGTYSNYCEHLNFIVEYFEKMGKMDISEVELSDFYNYINYERTRNPNITNRTINYRISSFKRALEFNRINFDYGNLKKLKEHKYIADVLYYDQLKKMFDYLESSKMSLKNKLIISLLFESGIRPNELMNLKKTDFDMEKELIKLKFTKTSTERFVCYHKNTKKYLKEYFENVTGEYLFKYYKYHAIVSLFRRIKKQVGFNNFYPYILRHSCATNLIMNGFDLEETRLYMGHENIQTTQKYLHIPNINIQNKYKEIFYK